MDTAGATAAVPAAVGYYVPTTGATAQYSAPAGTITYGGSVAARVAIDSLARDPANHIVGPVFGSDAGRSGTLLLGAPGTSGVYSLTLYNLSTNVGSASILTDLSLLNISFTGANAGLFSISTAPAAFLSEGGSSVLSFNYTLPSNGVLDASLLISTDESAGFGLTGKGFSYTLGASAVPEPANTALILILVVGVGAHWRRRNRAGRA